MTYQNILSSAIRMVCEEEEAESCADYEARAPYLLGTVCNECLPLDTRYRATQGASPAEKSIPCAVTMSEEFPLSAPFVPAVTYYLAAMLVLEENEDLSDKLFSLYTDAISTLQMQLPAKVEGIKNRYPGI
ncbi:MAG: hypothetical protein IKB75_01645 [Clostridia bacterium]|nr:hypothetical protein [Clostridia bacterium]